MSGEGDHQFPRGCGYPVDAAAMDTLCTEFLADSASCWLAVEGRRGHVLNLMSMHLIQGELAERFKEALGAHLSRCQPCLVQYIEARPAIQDLFGGRLHAKELAALEVAMEDWDRSRLTKNLTEVLEKEHSCFLLPDQLACLKLSLTILEMLSSPNQRLLRLFSVDVNALYRRITNAPVDVDLASFTNLLFDPVPDISLLTQAVVEVWQTPLAPATFTNLEPGLSSTLAQIPELIAGGRVQRCDPEVVSLWKSTLLALDLFPTSASAQRDAFLLPLCRHAMLSYRLDPYYDLYRDRCLAFIARELKSAIWADPGDAGLALDLIGRVLDLFMASPSPKLVYFEDRFKVLGELLELVVKSSGGWPHHGQVVDGTIDFVFKAMAHQNFRQAYKPKFVELGLRLTEYCLAHTPGWPAQSLCTHASTYLETLMEGWQVQSILQEALKRDVDMLSSHTTLPHWPLPRPPLLELWSSLSRWELPARSDLYPFVLEQFKGLAMLDRIALSTPALAQILDSSPLSSFSSLMAYLDTLLGNFLRRAAVALDPDFIQQLIEGPRFSGTLATLLLTPSGAIREWLMALLSKAGLNTFDEAVRYLIRGGRCQLAAPLQGSLLAMVRIVERHPGILPDPTPHFQLVTSLYQTRLEGLNLPADLAELLDSDTSAGFTLSLWQLVRVVVAANVGSPVLALQAARLNLTRASNWSVATRPSLFREVAGLLPPLLEEVAKAKPEGFYVAAAELVEGLLPMRSQLPAHPCQPLDRLAATLIGKLPEPKKSTLELCLTQSSQTHPTSATGPSAQPPPRDVIVLNSDSDSDYLEFLASPAIQRLNPLTLPTAAVQKAAAAPNREVVEAPKASGVAAQAAHPTPSTPMAPGAGLVRVQKVTTVTALTSDASQIPTSPSMDASQIPSTSPSMGGQPTQPPSLQIDAPASAHISNQNSSAPSYLASPPINSMNLQPVATAPPSAAKATKQLPITRFTTIQKRLNLEPTPKVANQPPHATTPLASIFTKNYARNLKLEPNSHPAMATLSPMHPTHEPVTPKSPIETPRPSLSSEGNQAQTGPTINQPPRPSSPPKLSSGGPNVNLRPASPKLVDGLPTRSHPRVPPTRPPARFHGVALVEKMIAKAKGKPTPIVNQARPLDYPSPLSLQPVLPKKPKPVGELTFATLPHLDPRIPKQANPILARSKSKANQLLRRIHVDQSAVKAPTASAGNLETSSSDASDSDGELDHFLKDFQPSVPPCKPPVKRSHPDSLTPVNVVESSSGGTTSDANPEDSSESEASPESDAANPSSRPALKLPPPRGPKVNKLMGTLIPTPALPQGTFSYSVDNFDFTVLRWSCEVGGDLPVWFNATRPYGTQFRSIPPTFVSVREYIEVLEPLLYLECWAKLQRAREEAFPDDAVACSIVSYHPTHRFFDVTLKAKLSSQFSENDLLMLTFPQPEVKTHAVKVLAKLLRVVTLQGSSGLEIRCCFDRDGSLALAYLKPNASASVLRLTSLSTMHRDYLALHGLSSYHLVNDILTGHAVGFDEPNPAKVQQLIRHHNLNRSQAEAIVASASKGEGFSLIQGPPGTGKTKTILGLVATLRHAARRDPVRATYWDRPQKLLICAPSNAAIDEIVRRLHAELGDPAGPPKLIRVGIPESINPAVQGQTLDYLVEARLRSQTSGDYRRAKDELDEHNAKVDKLRATLRQRRAEREQLREAAPSGLPVRPCDTERYQALKREIDELGDEIDRQIQLRGASSRAVDAARHRVRDELLGGADIICCTLAGAGHEMMQGMACDFDTVIIDEAAQAAELSTLIPLRFGCRRCIMIGDPHQLPPTVMSLPATKYGYNHSLFTRMFGTSGGTAHLLNVQYRMHPDISRLPSALFYDGRLLDAPGLTESKAAPWHASPLFPPYHLYDVEGADTANRHHSRENLLECEVACAIVRRLRHDFPDVDFNGRIAVISPYKGQIQRMRVAFSRRLGGVAKSIEFNTIDGFQGQEKDIVIFSCVRAGAAAEIGFLADVRRMNVGLTRAQKSLFVVGRAATLAGDPHWKVLVAAAKELGHYTRMDLAAFSVRGSPSHPNPGPQNPPASSKGKVASGGVASPTPSASSEEGSGDRAKDLPSSPPVGGGPRDFGAASNSSTPMAFTSTAVHRTHSRSDEPGHLEEPPLDGYTPNKRPAMGSINHPSSKEPKLDVTPAPSPCPNLHNSSQHPPHDTFRDPPPPIHPRDEATVILPVGWPLPAIGPTRHDHPSHPSWRPLAAKSPGLSRHLRHLAAHRATTAMVGTVST